MKIQPLKKYRNPNYPTRLDVTSDKTLLVRHVPPVWKKTSQLASLAALFLGVDGYAEEGKKAVVAPIFEHGDGVGSTGCMMVVAPVFLSEEEALQVIRDELKNSGLELSGGEAVLDCVFTRTREESYSYKKKQTKEEKPNPKPNRSDSTKENISVKFEIKEIDRESFRSMYEIKEGEPKAFRCDIVDATRSLAVEFVSREEYFELGGKKNDRFTVRCFMFKDISFELRENIQKSGKDFHVGIFYDPVYRDNEKLKELKKENNEIQRIELREVERIQSKRLLREQVADFVEWLKGQGAI